MTAKKRKVIFDLETNGLLFEATTIWIFVATDLATNETFVFSDSNPDDRPLSEVPAFLDECSMIGGHNVCLYDFLILQKLMNWTPKSWHKLVDTMIMSQVQNYKRFGFGHSLAKWGEFLGFPKVEHEDWSQYSPEMRKRCIVDVDLNVKVYDYLIKELKSRKQTELLSLGLKVEHGMSRFVGRSILAGWPFDVEAGLKLSSELLVKMESIKAAIEPQLKKRIKNFDAQEDVKSPAWVKTGHYAARTAGWFGFETKRGYEDDRPVWGDYCRVEEVVPDIGSMEAVKDLLYSLGWEPDEWNYSKDSKGRLTKTTPKLTDASLEPLGEVGKSISTFYSLRARHSILQGWLDEVVDGKLHGDCFVIGTPTGRSRHGVIANIPSSDALYGKEMRALFTVRPGYVMIGADSKGNQNRALAHYLGNAAYTEAICTGDIHTFNLRILESIVGPMGPDGRKKAKAFFVKEYVKLCELLGHPLRAISSEARKHYVYTTL